MVPTAALGATAAADCCGFVRMRMGSDCLSAASWIDPHHDEPVISRSLQHRLLLERPPEVVDLPELSTASRASGATSTGGGSGSGISLPMTGGQGRSCRPPIRHHVATNS